jgi:hypothetical protein
MPPAIKRDAEDKIKIKFQEKKRFSTSLTG